MNRETIGKYYIDDNGKEVIEREYYEQGEIYKNFETFENDPDKVCYIPELSDSKYTRNDFMGIAKGNVELAKELFYSVNWQHPESLLEDWEINGEVTECKNCGKYFDTFQNDCCTDICPVCGYKNE